MILWQLFWTFFKIGAFSFGGGYAMVPLIEQEIIARFHWLTMREFVDVIAIAEATPGPIAVNSATFVGYTTAGPLGSAAATVGVILPSFVVVVVLSWLFLKFEKAQAVQAFFAGIRPAVVALVIMAAVTVYKSAIVDIGTALICLACLAALRFTGIDPILLLAISAVVGTVLY
ncbi:MAG: chromate transporter [Bacteroidota bacterium]